MTSDEFYALPVGAQIKVIATLLHDRIDSVPYQEFPRVPKYDTMVFGKDGHVFASELTLDGLRFFADRARSSSNPKYAEQDAKRAAQLDKWIAYRQFDPTGQVTLVRGEDTVTSAPPSRFPTKHQRVSSDEVPF